MATFAHHALVSEPPLNLLEQLASIGEQRRYVIGATVDEYLLPEEVLNDASHFCERAEMPATYAKLTENQRGAVTRLKESIGRLAGCIELYDRSNLSDLIESDKCWAVMRSRAGDALTAFGHPVPE